LYFIYIYTYIHINIYICRRRWRYTAARSMWRARFLHIAASNFQAFKTLATHNINTRKLCWRKLKAWQYYCRRGRERRETYRVGFWPFHTWRKYAARKGRAKEKVRFLVGRVLPTLVQIKVFNAWKGYCQREGQMNRISRRHVRDALCGRASVCLLWLRRWTFKRRAIRRAWVQRGHALRQQQTDSTIVLPFYTWRAYSKYRRLLRSRMARNMHSMRRQLFGDKKPLHKRSNAENRILLKARQKKKTRKMNQEDLKRKLHHRAKDRKSVTSGGGGGASGYLGGSVSSVAGSVSASVMSVRSSVGGVETEEEEETAPVQGDAQKQNKYIFKEGFTWSMDITDGFDICTEEEEETTPTLVGYYEKAIVRDVPQPNILCEWYWQKVSSTGKGLLKDLQQECTTVDHLNLLEAACRFQFYAHRCFSNLRHNAKNERKVRLFSARRNRISMSLIFAELVHAMEARKKRLLGGRSTPAERLSHSVRDHQLMKVIRTRRFTNEVNSVLGRDFHDEEADDEARVRRMRMLNLIDPDDEAYQQREQARQVERQAELKRQREERDLIYKPPNLLEIDRLDREKEQEQAEEMVRYGQETTVESKALIQTADEYSDAFRIKARGLDEMVVEVLQKETAVTEKALAKQGKYMEKFKIHAADKMLSVLTKVYREVQLSLMKEESKELFRCLRLPMLLSRSKSLYHRKKMMNW
jgi:hypothetical protein